MALAAVLLPAALPAQAKWPDKPVKLILPFGAGGVADVSSRILADKLDKKLGQRFVIENMPGELMQRLEDDIVKWNAVIDKAGIPRK